MTTGAGVGTGDGIGRVTSGVVQADKANATTPSETSKLQRIEDIRISMWLLMVEAGVALFLLVFIVWWTMYSGKKPEQERQRDADPARAEKDEPPQPPGA